MAKYNIGGYIFNEEESAKKAAKELKTVEYILAQVKEADEKTVLQVYKKLINQKLFSTEIGMGFLNQLRQNLIASDVFDSQDVPEVYSLETDKPVDEPVEKTVESKAEKPTENLQAQKPEEKKEKDFTSKSKVQKKSKKKSIDVPDDAAYQIKKLKLINSILVVISITLLLCIVGMFYINSTINSPTILNYEESIIDEYSSWKQELEQKEAELKEREKALEQLENGQ